MTLKSTDKPEASSRLMKFGSIRLIFLIALIALYLIAWRPGRALLTEYFVVPAVELIVAQNPETHYLSTQQKSVTFTVYVLDETANSDANLSERWKEMVFSFPWGFYLFFPLLFFCFVRDYKPFVKIHLIFQLVTGIICIFAFILSLGLHDALYHLYKMLTYYIVPGFAFIVVFAAIFQQKFEKKLSPDNSP